MRNALTLLVLICVTGPAFGQVAEPPQLGPGVMVPMAVPVPADRVDPAVAMKKHYERKIALLISDMKRTCELSEFQVRRLQLAGKGAIAASMKKIEEQVERNRQAIGQWKPFNGLDEFDELGEGQIEGFDEGKEEEEVKDEAVKDTDDGEANDEEVAPVQLRAISVPFTRPSAVSKPTTELRWTKAVESVLTKKQNEKYAAVVKERAAFARKSAVAMFIAKVDRKLQLSSEQRRKLTTLIDDNFGEKLAERVGNRSSIWTTFGPAQPPPIDHAELKRLFSEPQLTTWKANFESELNQLKYSSITLGDPMSEL